MINVEAETCYEENVFKIAKKKRTKIVEKVEKNFSKSRKRFQNRKTFSKSLKLYRNQDFFSKPRKKIQMLHYCDTIFSISSAALLFLEVSSSFY